jgi:O-antigen/teichoic acid export membrane protein
VSQGFGRSDAEAQAALRNATLLAGQRGIDLLRAFAFAALVPRLLGPADFGRFVVLTSIGFWFTLLSSMGSTQLLGRFVPALDPGTEERRRLLGNLLVVRLLGGIGAALTYLLLTGLWLRELPLALPAAMATGVLLRSASNVLFAFFLGLNQAARWGMGELVRRWCSLVLIVPGVLLFGLAGACLGALLAEAVVLALGLVWARPHLRPGDVRLDAAFIGPYLRYNALFFGSNVIFSLCQRGTEALVRAVGADPEQVGCFSLAVSVYLFGAHALWHLATAFVPLVSRYRAEGHLAAALDGTGRLLKLAVAAGVLAFFAVALVGEPVVVLVAGAAFRPAAAALPPLAAALVAYAVACAARILALVLERPGAALAAAGVQAVALAVAGALLVPRLGALGGGLTVLVAGVLMAAMFVRGIRDVALPLRPALSALGAGAVALPLLLIRSGGPADVLLLAAGAAAYLWALRGLGLVTSDELAALRRGLSAVFPVARA